MQNKKKSPILIIHLGKCIIFASVIRQTGGKFTYSKASQDSNHKQIKESMELLELAGVVYPVTHTSANGLPFAVQWKISAHFKM